MEQLLLYSAILRCLEKPAASRGPSQLCTVLSLSSPSFNIFSQVHLFSAIAIISARTGPDFRSLSGFPPTELGHKPPPDCLSPGTWRRPP